MPTLEEMTAWTPEEVETEIRVNLPPGVRFDCGYDRDAGTWFVRFSQDTAVLFEDWGFDKRITYFNAYGWIWARQRPQPKSTSPWKPRQREVMPNIRTAKTRTPDPDDLNPTEIKAVYDRFREQPKKK